MSDREYPAHPLVGVGALIHKGDRILLVKRRFEPNRGRWTLPGGLLETGETLEQGSKREVLEELGLAVEIERLFHVFEEIIRDESGKVRFHYIIVDFLATPLGETIILNGESEDSRWFDPRLALELDISDNTRRIINRYIDSSSALGQDD